MNRLLAGRPPTDAQRRDNDRQHRPFVVGAVLLYLLVFAYLFTHLFEVVHLPAPQDLAAACGIQVDRVFDDDRNVDSTLTISLTQQFDTNDDERLVYYGIITAAFLSAYFLPLAYKQPALVGWTVTGLVLLFGTRATAGLLFAHLAVYVVLHPVRGRRLWLAGLAGALGMLAFGGRGMPMADRLPGIAFVALAAVPLYRYGLRPVLRHPRCGTLVRTMVVQSAMITVCSFAAWEGYFGGRWTLPLGILLFFWQWLRVIMYHIDHTDGLVPSDVSVWKYLAVFLSPAVIANWHWGVSIGQGYAYIHNNFLCEEKNKLVLDGLRLWTIALCYLVLGDWVVARVVESLEAYGLSLHHARTATLVEDYVAGEAVTTTGVLLTTMGDLFRWLIRWGGVVHFKVGVWRICGFRVDPYYNRPWLATNLATFWSRYAFHYRAFLVRAVYYPVFFRCFKKRPRLRLAVATMAAAGVGNLFYGHVSERLFMRGMTWENVLYELRTWPYFLALGLGIAASQIVLMRAKRNRKPWTPGPGILLDVVGAYTTMQFYSLIRIFRRPCSEGTTADLLQLVLIGLGIPLP